MEKTLLEEIRGQITGEVVSEGEALKEASHDASIFEVRPEVVVFPKNQEDVQKLVNLVRENKTKTPNLSLTARAAGTDMSGGPLSDSIVISFAKYFNQTPTIENNLATTEPGVFYRDFEKETLARGLIFPSYPASKMICAMGGIVNNNSGGEKSLQYGKTEKYIKKVKVVLADGEIYELAPLNQEELKAKLALKNFEGELYQKMMRLVVSNRKLIKEARPKVTKNSAGYNLWDVWNEETGVFDLTKLWVGSQGTLGLMLSAQIELVPVKKLKQMVIIQLPDMNNLGEIINKILPHGPESFETYDDNTLKLALHYFWEFKRQLGIWGMLGSAVSFLPMFWGVLTGTLPKLMLQVEFTGDDKTELQNKVSNLLEELKPFKVKTQTATGHQIDKYWLVRRESFNLLRSKVKTKHTVPFIDDFVIDPQKIQTVIPQVTEILSRYPQFIFTVAGHVGDGNFHIIPLVDTGDPAVREAIPKIAGEVYKIVLENGGSTNGEHNDGLIRTPYLNQMFGDEMVKLFEEVKMIFDPTGIFNPRKKVKGDLKFAMEHLRVEW